LIPFVKVQSVGNDFVLVEARHAGDDLSSLAIRMCARHTSIGSDGLLVVEPLDPLRIRMRMFNPDGTEDFCGNGLRCAAVYAAEEGWVDPAGFVIEHFGRDVPSRVEGARATTVLGRASFRAGHVPWGTEAQADEEWFQRELSAGSWSGLATLVSTGSTHTILLVDELPDDLTVSRLGAQLEHHPLFPQRTSVIWAKRVGEDVLKVRIWERGVGETWGCGTGSSAAAVTVGRMDDRGARRIQVDNPGGTVWVSFTDWTGDISAEGEAFRVYSGEF
jgi:diaminopimelate epimerase